MHYVPAFSARRKKFDVRWVDGVWLGVKLETGESIIGTPEGAVKARAFRRKPENGGRWGNDGIDGCKGVPWEPYLGAGGGYEIKSKVRLPTESGELTKIVEGEANFVPRTLRIKKEEWEKFGITTGCPGSRAANKGSAAVRRSEECRKRITEELTKLGDEAGGREDHQRELEVVRVPDRGGEQDKEET